METDVSKRDALAQLLEGRSDDDINAFAAQAGVETALEQVFQGMQEYFRGDRAQGVGAVVQWDVESLQGAHTYQVKVANGALSWARGAAEPARVTFRMSLPDFLRLVAGTLDGMQAFMSGKLKLAGDMMFAPAVQTWFAPR
jgi:putative sterol carrier protein